MTVTGDDPLPVGTSDIDIREEDVPHARPPTPEITIRLAILI